MSAPLRNLTRRVAVMAAALVLVGALQQTQSLCRLFGCGGHCGHVAHSTDGQCASHCCDAARAEPSEEQSHCRGESHCAGESHCKGESRCPGEEAPAAPCDESCWCFAAEQPYEQVVKVQAELGLSVACLPPAPPTVCSSAADQLVGVSRSSGPPLRALERCVLLSRFLA
ncbi:hypothetical protein [Botrimarina sp.]|uniref:hypothetical protein n=1 Tax=Botrimarina sp. TaxID=2795802 RepID=UPI0032EEF071